MKLEGENVGLVSVVVPAYNCGTYLQRCLDSLVVQTLPELQIILIDDGSTDCTGKIADNYARQYRNLFVYHQKNGGVSLARNAGVKMASGEFIGFVDADDYVAPDMFEKLYTAVQKESAQLAVCGYQELWENGRERQIVCGYTPMILEDAEDIFLHCIACHPLLCNKLFSKQLFENTICFPPISAGEDYLFCCELLPRIDKAVVLEEILYSYVQHQGSAMRCTKCTNEDSIFTSFLNLYQTDIQKSLWFQMLFCAFAGTLHSPNSWRRPVRYFRKALSRLMEEPYGLEFCQYVQVKKNMRALVDRDITGKKFSHVARVLFFLLQKIGIGLPSIMMKLLSDFIGWSRLREVTFK